MSEERSGWAGGREDAAWWEPHHHQQPEFHHHHHHQEQQQQQQQHQLAAAHQEAFRNSAVHHLFGYKMPGPGGSSYGQPPSQWWHYEPSEHQPPSELAGPHPLLSRKMPKVAKSGAEAKPRGRMTAYAFFVQICREEHKKKHPEENVVFAEFSKKCAERWKTMSDKEKKRFHEMADKDKKRYETEMQGYTPSESEKKAKRGKKRKQAKDPNAPKRSLSAFFWFSSDERGKVKEANPEFGVGEIAKELGRRWSDADPSVKSKYEEMADKDKARYDREMTEYKKKGKVSAAPVPQPKKVAASDDEEDEEEDDDDDV